LLSTRPPSTLFPYTTLFRSLIAEDVGRLVHRPHRHAPAQLFDDLRPRVRPRPRRDRVDHELAIAEPRDVVVRPRVVDQLDAADRSEEHTSELQSRGHLVCRL